VHLYWKPLGGLRVRQSRVRRHASCDTAGVLKTNLSASPLDPYCYGEGTSEWDTLHVDKQPFGTLPQVLSLLGT
jgi:hypothetical protein